jgi:hypothetical protein
MATKKPAEKATAKKPAGDAAEINDHNRNTEADTEQATPLVDGAGNPVIGGVSVEKE